MLPKVLSNLVAQYVGDDIDTTFDFKDTLYDRYKHDMDRQLLVDNSSIPIELLLNITENKYQEFEIKDYIANGRMTLTQISKYPDSQMFSHLFGWCQEVVDAFILQEEQRVLSLIDKFKEAIEWCDQEQYITYRGLKITVN